MSYKDKDILNVNVRQDLIVMLDANISGFRDIEWRSKSKRFTKKDAKTIKYELVVLITDCYWGHELKHKDDGRYYSLYYETLKDKLGKNYRKHIDVVFDIVGGVSISSPFRKNGSTLKYRLKKVVKDICDDLFKKNIKLHSLVGRTGKVMTAWEEYAVSKTNEKGEFQKKVDNKKYTFSSKVLLNKNNGTILTYMFSDLYKYKTGRLKTKEEKEHVKKWIDIIKKAGGDINTNRRWDGDRLERLHQDSLEIYNEMMVDIIGVGYVGQLYKERNTGRLFGTGGCNLQGMMREQRRILMGGLGYFEYDMENAHYNILDQYYRMITGNKLNRITKYIQNTKGYRTRLEQETNNSEKTIKTCLISIIYGAGISRMTYKDEDLAIWKVIKKDINHIKTAEKLWYDFTDNIIVKELYTEVDIAYKAIRHTWVETGSGKGRRLKNMSNKTTRMTYEDDKPKSKGMLLSHFLQGIEARILLGIIREEGKDGFVMPHHDGWVSKINHDTDRLQDLIGKDTRKMLLDYNGVRGSFDIPIEKVELTDIVDGDWKDLIIKKGVVSPLH